MALSVRFEGRDEGDTVYFQGTIDEDAEIVLSDLKSKLSKKIIFNLKAISSVNSCGVRAWINFMREAEKSSELTFEECTPEIVNQMNMIPNFRGKASVKSIYGSFVCDDCDEQKLELYTKGQNLPQKPTDPIPPVPCPKCQKPMEMEELPEEFFGWLDLE